MDALEAYCEAVEARTEAERAAEGAAPESAAAFELETARMAAENARARVGGAFVVALRCAVEECEPGLALLLERLAGTATMARLEERARDAEEACAWAVAEIAWLKDEVRRLRAENWELAQAVYDLQLELTEGVEHGTAQSIDAQDQGIPRAGAANGQRVGIRH